MCFIIVPLAVIVVTSDVNNPAVAIGLVIGPVALVLGAILPEKDSHALPKAVSGPLTEVDSPVIQLVRSSVNYMLLNLFIFVVLEPAQLRLGLFHCRVRNLWHQLNFPCEFACSEINFAARIDFDASI